MELALGKAGGLGVDLGKVFEDLPPDDFLITGGGPEESGRVVFTCSDEEDRRCFPWKPPLGDGVDVVEPVLEDGVDAAWAVLGEVLVVGALDKIDVPVLEVGPDAAALEDAPKSGAELEVTGPDLGG